jgi:hypothetical protein
VRNLRHLPLCYLSQSVTLVASSSIAHPPRRVATLEIADHPRLRDPEVLLPLLQRPPHSALRTQALPLLGRPLVIVEFPEVRQNCFVSAYCRRRFAMVRK